MKVVQGLELPPEVALQPHKAVYRAADHQLIGSEFPGQIKTDGSYPDLFEVVNGVDATQIAHSAEKKGCKMSYPS